MADVRLSLPKLHRAQRFVVGEAERFNVLACGRRFGKTALGLDLLVSGRGGALEGGPVAWFAPTYKLLDEVWRDARRTVGPVISRIDSQQKRIELVTGGAIDFWTLDDPDAGRGRKYRRVVIDEAAMARYLEEAWQQAIRATLTDYRGDAWFFSTPKGRNYFGELFDRGVERRPGWRSWRLPTEANPYILPSEIEIARRELPELVFRQEYLAEFVDMAGTLVKAEHLQYADPPGGPGRVSIGVDLAISSKEDADFTAMVATTRVEGRVYVLEALRFRGQFSDIIDRVRQFAAKWRPTAIMVETVQFQTAVVTELLRRTSLPVLGVRPDRDKVTRFLPVLARYEQGMIVHAPGIDPAFDREILAFPVGEHDDFADALAYSVLGLDKSEKSSPLLKVASL